MSVLSEKFAYSEDLLEEIRNIKIWKDIINGIIDEEASCYNECAHSLTIIPLIISDNKNKFTDGFNIGDFEEGGVYEEYTEDWNFDKDYEAKIKDLDREKHHKCTDDCVVLQNREEKMKKDYLEYFGKNDYYSLKDYMRDNYDEHEDAVYLCYQKKLRMMLLRNFNHNNLRNLKKYMVKIKKLYDYLTANDFYCIPFTNLPCCGSCGHVEANEYKNNRFMYIFFNSQCFKDLTDKIWKEEDYEADDFHMYFGHAACKKEDIEIYVKFLSILTKGCYLHGLSLDMPGTKIGLI